MCSSSLIVLIAFVTVPKINDHWHQYHSHILSLWFVWYCHAKSRQIFSSIFYFTICLFSIPAEAPSQWQKSSTCLLTQPILFFRTLLSTFLTCSVVEIFLKLLYLKPDIYYIHFIKFKTMLMLAFKNCSES